MHSINQQLFIEPVTHVRHCFKACVWDTTTKTGFCPQAAYRNKRKGCESVLQHKLQRDAGKLSLFQWREESLFLRVYRAASWRQENGEEIS